MLHPVVVMLNALPVLYGGSMNTHFTLPANSCSSAFSASRLSPKISRLSKMIVLRHPMLRVVRLRRILQQDARLQLRPVLLADPGQFEFLFLCHFKSRSNLDGKRTLRRRHALVPEAVVASASR